MFLVLAGSGVMFYSNKVLKHDVTTLDYKFKDVGQLVTQEWYGRMLNSPEKNDRKLFKILAVEQGGQRRPPGGLFVHGLHWGSIRATTMAR